MNWIRTLKDRRLTDRPSLVTPVPTSGKLGQVQLRRRYGTELLGALIFIVAIAVFNSYYHGASSQDAKVQSSATHGTTITQTQSTPPNHNPGADAPFGSPTNTQEDSAMPGSSNNDTTDTQVTVNGVDLAVPVNGASQQTLSNGDGSNTSVNISSNQTSSGTASGANHTSTHLHVSTTTRTNDSRSESVSETP